MDLQAFIVRARVLKLYRDALKVCQHAPPHTRAELRQTMRAEMEKNRVCSDKQKLRFLLSEGMRRLKELREMLDMAGASPHC